jgi:hypothetical protein
MKKSTALLLFFFSLFLFNCEKVDPETEIPTDPDTEVNSSQLKSSQVYAFEEINYLLSLIEDIESMVEEGLLSEGNGNALIVKIKNAIKSHEKCNTTTAATNQLEALINQLKAFVTNGVLTEEKGEFLITAAEYGIVLLNPLINTTWDFVIRYSETGFWHADVTFYADGTTRYDEPHAPGLYLSYGTWSMECNTLYYIMDYSRRHEYAYHFTGTLSGNTMSGTCTFGPEWTFTWTATLK